MGPGNQRWGQFLFLVLLISSFFYFILQADVEEDFVVDLQDEQVPISKSFDQNFFKTFDQINKLSIHPKKTNFLQPQGLAPIFT